MKLKDPVLEVLFWLDRADLHDPTGQAKSKPVQADVSLEDLFVF